MNRREFLSAGAAGLGLSARAMAEQLADQKPKRVGIIGPGWYGKCDLFRLIQVSPVEVVSMCDVDKQMLSQAAEMVAARQASKKTPRLFGDYREMLKEKDLDICLVATPDHWHALPMIAAVQAGADVWVQKPICVRTSWRARAWWPRRASTDAWCRWARSGAARRTWWRRASRSSAKANWARSAWWKSILIAAAEAARIRRRWNRRRAWITKCGPVRRRCGRSSAVSIRGAGGNTWSTATARWATWGSTCST